MRPLASNVPKGVHFPLRPSILAVAPFPPRPLPRLYHDVPCGLRPAPPSFCQNAAVFDTRRRSSREMAEGGHPIFNQGDVVRSYVPDRPNAAARHKAAVELACFVTGSKLWRPALRGGIPAHMLGRPPQISPP